MVHDPCQPPRHCISPCTAVCLFPPSRCHSLVSFVVLMSCPSPSTLSRSLRSVGMLVVGLVFAAGAVISTRIIHYRKLAVITFTIVNNVLLGLGMLMLLVGLLMVSTSAFIATADLSFIVGSVRGGECCRCRWCELGRAHVMDLCLKLWGRGNASMLASASTAQRAWCVCRRIWSCPPTCRPLPCG